MEPSTSMVCVDTDLNRIILTAATDTTTVTIPNIIVTIVDIIKTISFIIPTHGKTEVNIRSIFFSTNITFTGNHVWIIKINPQLVRHSVPFGNVTIER